MRGRPDVGPALAADTRKLSSTEAFERLTADALPDLESADDCAPSQNSDMPICLACLR
jgi:hypothetical protein